MERGGTANLPCRGDYPRGSSDNPILKAFCRVAPSVLLSFLGIFGAGVFLRAIVFSSRTCPDVQPRLFDPFFINKRLALITGSASKEEPRTRRG